MSNVDLFVGIGQRADLVRRLMLIDREVQDQIASLLGVGGKIHALMIELNGGRLPDRLPQKKAVHVDRSPRRVPEWGNLTTRCVNALIRSGVGSLEQAQGMSDEELYAIRNFGPKHIAEVRATQKAGEVD